jgi:hypothetical protein
VPPPVPLRLAFVGQRVYFGSCALEDAVDGVEPRFFDLHPNAPGHELGTALTAFGPDVVIAFRPDLVPAGALDGVDAVRVGWLTEPLPRPGTDPEAAHPDLRARLQALQGLDPSQFERIVSFDPLIAPTADRVAPVWRSLPLPVSDRMFARVVPRRGAPRILFVGRSTAHRERFLGPLKHDFDVLHLAHGVTGGQLGHFMADADIAVNLHNEPYPTFENRVQTSLAAGLLVLTEPLSPLHGLRHGVHLLEARTPGEAWELVHRAARTPGAFLAVRHAGRAAAERFRASRVYPRLAREVLADVALRGAGSRVADGLGTARSHGGAPRLPLS